MDQRRVKVLFSRAAQRDLEKIEAGDARQIAKDVKEYLESSPLPFGKTRIKKLTGFEPPLYRLRSGDFRIYYRISGYEVVLLGILNRRDSEKLLKKLR